ncbi:MAG TPA: hypothetical protein VK601_11735 [Kofleriaceae bacterium]|nr:hypothetical protein [Kofleriaceae bacterium]
MAGMATRTAASEILERHLLDMFARFWMELTRSLRRFLSSAADKAIGQATSIPVATGSQIYRASPDPIRHKKRQAAGRTIIRQRN